MDPRPNTPDLNYRAGADANHDPGVAAPRTLRTWLALWAVWLVGLAAWAVYLSVLAVVLFKLLA